VVLATHSDRLLDAVQDPAKSIVICELDSKRATRLVRPDPTVLAKWLDDYRGFGDIRSTGLQDAVLPPREDVR
jgi:predicted ATPase